MRIVLVLSAYTVVLVAALFAPGDPLGRAALLVGLVLPATRGALAAGSLGPVAAAVLLNAVPFALIAGPTLGRRRAFARLTLAALAGVATVALVAGAAIGVDQSWAARGVAGLIGLTVVLGVAPGALAAVLARVVPAAAR
ncbi:MAG TPA: hypothetical protein VNA89_10950 [Gemmatimonadaceae bacterium]|nr:hypothetical protein [Gemmatimonadaceae bacterium]